MPKDIAPEAKPHQLFLGDKTVDHALEPIEHCYVVNRESYDELRGMVPDSVQKKYILPPSYQFESNQYSGCIGAIMTIIQVPTKSQRLNRMIPYHS